MPLSPPVPSGQAYKFAAFIKAAPASPCNCTPPRRPPLSELSAGTSPLPAPPFPGAPPIDAPHLLPHPLSTWFSSQHLLPHPLALHPSPPPWVKHPALSKGAFPHPLTAHYVHGGLSTGPQTLVPHPSPGLPSWTAAFGAPTDPCSLSLRVSLCCPPPRAQPPEHRPLTAPQRSPPCHGFCQFRPWSPGPICARFSGHHLSSHG